MPGASIAPAASRAKNKKHTSKVTTGTPKHPGIPRAMVLTASFALSLVIGLSCHHPRVMPACRSRGTDIAIIAS
jgi:hypothetical protein